MKFYIARFIASIFRQSFMFQTNFTSDDASPGKVYTNLIEPVYAAGSEEVYV